MPKLRGRKEGAGRGPLTTRVIWRRTTQLERKKISLEKEKDRAYKL